MDHLDTEMRKQALLTVVPDSSYEAFSQGLPTCCQKSILAYSSRNEMLACDDCGRIIKLYEDELVFQNFVTFCNSRHRKIITGECNGYSVVAFYRC